MPTNDQITATTLAWVRHAVIGLNLCPFAGPVVSQQRLRIAVSTATDTDALLEDLASELRLLAETDASRIETTLLVHPGVLGDFFDFNGFLDQADQALDALDLTGVIQVASFHPDYQFAGTDADDIGNATNRSPYPTLHLLRESSIERAVDGWGDTTSIYQDNLNRMEALGLAGWQRLMREWLGEQSAD